MAELLVARLATRFTDPIRVACFAGVISVELAFIFFEVKCHALCWLVTHELYGTTNDHYSRALGELVGSKWSFNVVDHTLLGHHRHILCSLSFFLLLGYVYICIEAS